VNLCPSSFSAIFAAVSIDVVLSFDLGGSTLTVFGFSLSGSVFELELIS